MSRESQQLAHDEADLEAHEPEHVVEVAVEEYGEEAHELPAESHDVADGEVTGQELVPHEEHEVPAEAASHKARPIPRISIQAFCEDDATAECLQIGAEDRRLAKTHVAIHMGGISAAVAHYQDSPTPNLIIIQSLLLRDELIGELDRLAESCDAGTKVIVIGDTNDVILYRELLKRGVSEYLIAPITPIGLLESISNLYNHPGADPVGNVLAFIGAKGGVGSSTICHNVAWALSEALKSNVVISDFDMAFGTAGLDFNQDPMQGMGDAISSPERLDEVLLDRLLTKCSEHLSIFAAPIALDREYDLIPEGCETIVDVVRQNVPFVALDLPHVWTGWTKKLLMQADEVVITAAPDLANLRNTKAILEQLKTGRKHDRPPTLVINTANMPKRPEIAVKEFCQSLELNAAAVIEFDAETFGQAANNGQMVEELSKKAKAAPQFREIAMALAHRKEVRVEPKKPVSLSTSLFEKLKFKR